LNLREHISSEKRKMAIVLPATNYVICWMNKEDGCFRGWSTLGKSDPGKSFMKISGKFAQDIRSSICRCSFLNIAGSYDAARKQLQPSSSVDLIDRLRFF
jgi:hypothetical protein